MCIPIHGSLDSLIQHPWEFGIQDVLGKIIDNFLALLYLIGESKHNHVVKKSLIIDIEMGRLVGINKQRRGRAEFLIL
jgi:hypothetical protein